jgi:DNA mismatch endonuclease, patch repair protein
MVPEPRRPVGTDAQRSHIMRSVGRRNTAPEVTLRTALAALGLMPQRHRRDLPGTPDLVFSQHRLAVFVHGCFWHRHARCRLATTPKTNSRYWQQKFAANIDRDRRKCAELRKRGWKTMTVWQCRIEKNAAAVAARVKAALAKAKSD